MQERSGPAKCPWARLTQQSMLSQGLHFAQIPGIFWPGCTKIAHHHWHSLAHFHRRQGIARNFPQWGSFPLFSPKRNLAAANGGVTNGGLRGVWPPFLEIGRNRPFSPFFCLFRPFSEGAKSTWEIQKTEEKGLFPQISSNLLKPPSLKPPFAALQRKSPFVSDFRSYGWASRKSSDISRSGKKSQLQPQIFARLVHSGSCPSHGLVVLVLFFIHFSTCVFVIQRPSHYQMSQDKQSSWWLTTSCA